MNFDDALALVAQQAEFEMPTGWGQGRTVYGGFVAALLMERAFITLDDPEREPLSASITFVGPVQHQQAKITVEVLREGSAVTTLEARLWQNDQVQTIMLASFGKRRDSQIEIHQEASAPAYPGYHQLEAMPFIEGLIPECFKQYELYWAEGKLPFAASQHADFGGWFRFKQDVASGRMRASHMVALADIWPPGITPLFPQPAPASSLTWHLTFIQPITMDCSDWLCYQVQTSCAKDGYATETAYIWDAHGRLLATNQQTITIFA
ncbi:thioesterase family protein [Acinetobacter puyangensis]|uniref:Acyl-CoA thioesterase n=1 Tax=Acinetobacter puyangensis TaxID=1096779 RepID=A0A240E6G0_9GAMM|nr:thioesterase family protein [Acinetobacter puyangensis]SNX44348.1 Acyl-CoA thioesterase [Acinetobacter puyangensis]